MANQDTQLAVKSRVEQRVTNSKALIERMGMSVEQYETVAVNALITTPTICDCTPTSIERAFIQCMQLGLMPDGKQAAIVPFNDRENGKQATLIPMIKGQLMLARRAVPGIVLQAKTVYREDEFEHEEGTEPFIRHIPNANGSRTDGDIVAVYARAKFPNAKEWEFEVLYRADIDRYRAYSRSGQKGPWVQFYGEQAKKTVMKQLLKRLDEMVGIPNAPDAPPIELDGMDLEDDVAGIINAEQGSYAVSERLPRDIASPPDMREYEGVDTTTGEIIDHNAGDAPRRQRRPRVARQEAQEAEQEMMAAQPQAQAPAEEQPPEQPPLGTSDDDDAPF